MKTIDSIKRKESARRMATVAVRESNADSRNREHSRVSLVKNAAQWQITNWQSVIAALAERRSRRRPRA